MKNIYRFLFCSITVWGSFFLMKAQADSNTAQIDSVATSIKNIDYYLRRYTEWYPQNYEVALKMRSLVHYLKDQRVDTILGSLEDYQSSEKRYFFRTLDNVSDSLNAPGYVSHQILKEEQAKIDRNVRDNFNVNEIKVPKSIIEQAQLNINLLTPNEASKLIGSKYVDLPDSLLALDSMINLTKHSVEDLKRVHKMDSIRSAILEEARQKYNATILKQAEDSVSNIYKEQVVTTYSLGEQRKYAIHIAKQNRQMLESYNEQVTKQANDSINTSLRILLNYVNNERISMWIYNSMEDSTEVLLSNNQPFTSRFFIKNIQKDSLGVRVLTKDRNSIAMFIDDGVTLNRFRERKHRGADLARVNLDDNLTNIKKKYEIVTPWTYGGVLNLALNQTYLKNWVKGGETSLAGLFTFKGYANYNLDKITWSNTLDVRSGWISPSDGGLEKNEDRFELISKFGLQAVKKWYYTAETDLETQLFNSYDYPDRTTPKSGFMAPLKSLFKLGMDYKKDDNLSLFVSPITIKCVSMRDTSIYDQTQFGIDEDSKSFWDLGLNLDIAYSQKIFENLSVNTKYKMFIDYKNIFTAYDVDWENTFDFKINNFMKAQIILHLLYDDNVTFDTGKVDASGEAIYKAKWQFREFFTLGFTYSLDREIKRRRKIIN
ncbi:MAG: DUF3078 domain-containing protein [Mangrovibacterium sp.]